MAHAIVCSRPDDTHYHPRNHGEQSLLDDNLDHTTPIWILYAICCVVEHFGPDGIVGIPVYLLQCVSNCYILSVWQLGSSYRYVPKSYDYKPR